MYKSGVQNKVRGTRTGDGGLGGGGGGLEKRSNIFTKKTSTKDSFSYLTFEVSNNC